MRLSSDQIQLFFFCQIFIRNAFFGFFGFGNPKLSLISRKKTDTWLTVKKTKHLLGSSMAGKTFFSNMEGSSFCTFESEVAEGLF